MTRDLAQVKPQSNAVNVWHSACMYVPIGSNTHAPSNKVKSVLKGPSLLLCKSA